MTTQATHASAPIVPNHPTSPSNSWPFPEVATLNDDSAPMPTIEQIFSKDLSLLPSGEWATYMRFIYQIINYHAVLRLGLPRAISVLTTLVNHQHPTTDSITAPKYKEVIRPYEIEQPVKLPPLSPLYSVSEANHFAESVRTLTFLVGLQPAVRALSEAKIDEVPPVTYVVIYKSIVVSSPFDDGVTTDTDPTSSTQVLEESGKKN